MEHSKKKKQKAQRPNKSGAKSAACEKVNEESKVNRLVKDFASVSLDEAASAHREAKRDPNKGAEILGTLPKIVAKVCSSSSGSSRSSLVSRSAERFIKDNCGCHVVRGRDIKRPTQKKVVATAGMVSKVLGKDYVMSSSNKDSSKGYTNGPPNKEEAEKLLCKMLDVARCILGQCGYRVEKVPDRSTVSPCHTSESKIQDSIWFMCCLCRKYAEVVTGSEVHSLTGPSSSKSSEVPKKYAEVVTGSEVHSSTGLNSSKSLELPQKVLESLFNMPNSFEDEPSTMYLNNMAKMMKSFANKFECVRNNVAQTGHIQAKGDDYQVFREPARRHWESMESCYQEARTASSSGKWEYAARLHDQGRLYNKMAREADEKASLDIFEARNESIENFVTIDLHGQHIKQALWILKIHLFFGVSLRSVQILRVITGRGNHGGGESKLKQSVIKLVQKAGIEWSEENPGLIRIRLDRLRKFTFLGSDSEGK